MFSNSLELSSIDSNVITMLREQLEVKTGELTEYRSEIDRLQSQISKSTLRICKLEEEKLKLQYRQSSRETELATELADLQYYSTEQDTAKNSLSRSLTIAETE